MKRFLLRTSITSAEGTQIWYVDAETEADALAKYKQGDCEIYSEEIEVQDLSKPEIIGTTDLDDGGEFGDTNTSDAAFLDFFENNTACELSCEEWEDKEWVVHRVSGGRNDREWVEIGRGSTPREAINAAIAEGEQG